MPDWAVIEPWDSDSSGKYHGSTGDWSVQSTYNYLADNVDGDAGFIWRDDQPHGRPLTRKLWQYKFSCWIDPGSDSPYARLEFALGVQGQNEPRYEVWIIDDGTNKYIRLYRIHGDGSEEQLAEITNASTDDLRVEWHPDDVIVIADPSQGTTASSPVTGDLDSGGLGFTFVDNSTYGSADCTVDPIYEALIEPYNTVQQGVIVS